MDQMSGTEKRWVIFSFCFLFVVILLLFTVTNIRISNASERIDQKADIIYVNYTVLSKYDSIMILLNDIKVTVNNDKDRGRNKDSQRRTGK